MTKYLLFALLFAGCLSDSAKLELCLNNYLRNQKQYQVARHDSLLTFVLRSIPSDVRAIQTIKRAKGDLSKEFDAVYNEKKNDVYLLLELQANDPKKVQDFFGNTTIKNYLSFDFQKDIYCLNNGDTVFLNNYHYEDYYGLANSNKINLSFDKKAVRSDQSLDFHIKRSIPTENISMNLKLNLNCCSSI